MQNNLSHKEIIKLAEEVGLLTKDDNFPYSCSAHMRFISRLEKFGNKRYNEGYTKGVEDTIVTERG